jgi:hypothetical protein
MGGVPGDVSVLAIPCDVCLSVATGKALLEFVRRGGVLCTEGRFALLTENGYVHPRVPGGGLDAAFGVAEVHFTCDARDTVTFEAAPGAPLVIHDYQQHLQLTGTARAVVSSDSGRPIVVESQVGDGRYLHASVLLGRAIHQGAAGALTLFGALFERIRPALTPAVTVRRKPPMVDVSVLVSADRRVSLIGICNYRHEPSRVELAGTEHEWRTDGDTSTQLTRVDGGWVIDVPARHAVAVLP